MKKLPKIFLVLLCVIAVLILISCSTTAPPDEDEDNTIDEDFFPDKKDIVLRRCWYSVTNSVILADLVETFELDNPGYTLRIVEGNGVGDTAGLALAIQTGTCPDIVNDGYWTYHYFQDLIIPWDDYLTRDEKYNMEDLHPMVWEVFSGYDDKLYGLSGMAYVWMLAINRNLFEEAGIDPDDHPKTWERMVELQKALSRVNSSGKVDKTGFTRHLTASDTWILSYFYNGEGHVNKQGYLTNINSEGMRALYTWFMEMEDVMGGRNLLTADVINDGFRKGNVAMTTYLRQPGFIGLDFDISVCAFPNAADNGDDMWVCGYQEDTHILPREAPDPDASWFYMRWYLTQGMIKCVEAYNFHDNPAVYFPRYMINQYARERCYDLYLEYVDDNTIRNIKTRDDLMNKLNCFDVPDSCREAYWMVTEAESLMTSRGSRSIAETLASIQRRAELATDKWLEELRSKNWIIDAVENPWGIPPSVQGLD